MQVMQEELAARCLTFFALSDDPPLDLPDNAAPPAETDFLGLPLSSFQWLVY